MTHCRLVREEKDKRMQRNEEQRTIRTLKDSDDTFSIDLVISVYCKVVVCTFL